MHRPDSLYQPVDLNWQRFSHKPTPVTSRPPPECLNGIRTDEIPVQLTSPCPRWVETSHNTPHFVLNSHSPRLLGYVSSGLNLHAQILHWVAVDSTVLISVQVKMKRHHNIANVNTDRSGIEHLFSPVYHYFRLMRHYVRIQWHLVLLLFFQEINFSNQLKLKRDGRKKDIWHQKTWKMWWKYVCHLY